MTDGVMLHRAARGECPKCGWVYRGRGVIGIRCGACGGEVEIQER